MNTDPLRDLLARHMPARDVASPAVPAQLVQTDPFVPEPYTYPQVIVVQGRQHPSWLRDHAGHLIAAAGIGVLALAVLAVVAIKAMTVASSQSHGRWSR